VKEMQTLQSERLVLRMFGESDLDAYAEMCGDADVMRYLGDGHTLTRAEAWRHMAFVIGHWHLRGFGLWAVEERRTGQLAGRVGCWHPEGWPGFEVGWALRRRFWGKGYATEAALQAIDFAFNQLGQERVISLIQPENGNSVAVATRLGMSLLGEADIMGRRVLKYGLSRAAQSKE
jgi:RimJ/RimL family protein N-acetyltransferase